MLALTLARTLTREKSNGGMLFVAGPSLTIITFTLSYTLDFESSHQIRRRIGLKFSFGNKICMENKNNGQLVLSSFLRRTFQFSKTLSHAV